MQFAVAIEQTGTHRRAMAEASFLCNRAEVLCVVVQGSKEKRLTGDEHMAVVDEFCAAAQHCFPNCLIQFEDFQTNQAFAILDRMRNKYLCFNDDIQGTGGVVTAG